MYITLLMHAVKPLGDHSEDQEYIDQTKAGRIFKRFALEHLHHKYNFFHC